MTYFEYIKIIPPHILSGKAAPEKTNSIGHLDRMMCQFARWQITKNWPSCYKIACHTSLLLCKMFANIQLYNIL
jgi:hypothetical protein